MTTQSIVIKAVCITILQSISRIYRFAVCDDPPGVPNTILSVHYHGCGMYAIYTCKNGFIFEEGGSTRSIICVPGNYWSANVAPCVGRLLKQILAKTFYLVVFFSAIECPSLDPQPAVEDEDKSSLVVGSHFEHHCPPGASFLDGLCHWENTCTARGDNGVWLHSSTGRYSTRDLKNFHIIVCCIHCLLVNTCIPPKFIVNGYLTGYISIHGSTLEAVCYPDYRLPNGQIKATYTCRQTGEWDPITDCKGLYSPKHKRDSLSLLRSFWRLVQVCPLLDETLLKNGELLVDLALRGSIAVASCHLGFSFFDSMHTKFLLCQDDYTWNDTLHTCLSTKSASSLDLTELIVFSNMF
jgi:hypothetical protein